MNKLQEAVNVFALAGGNKAQAARELGVARSTLQGYLAQAEREGIRPNEKSEDPETRHKIKEIELEDRVRELNQQVRALSRENVTSRKVREFFFDLKEHEAAPPLWTMEEASTGSPGIPVIFLSDLHFGEVVNPISVNHLNEFNTEIAEERLKKVAQNVIDLSFNHMVNPDYPGLVVALGGDMFSGDIHEELETTNEHPTMVSLFRLFDNLVAFFNLMLDHFDNIFVPTAYGNHGRNTKKPRHKEAAYTNFDWVLYNMLERHYSHDPRITFKVTDSFDSLFQIYNHTYLLTHGDRIGTGGGNGIIGAIAPILRGVQKIKGQYSNVDIDVDTVIMGHYHQYIPLRDVIVNGSLKGYDEYAMAMRFPSEPAIQGMWFNHPMRGITFQIPIHCEEPEVEIETPNWVSIPKSS